MKKYTVFIVSYFIVWVIKQKRIIWEKYLASRVETVYTYRILPGQPQGKALLCAPELRSYKKRTSLFITMPKKACTWRGDEDPFHSFHSLFPFLSLVTFLFLRFFFMWTVVADDITWYWHRGSIQRPSGCQHCVRYVHVKRPVRSGSPCRRLTQISCTFSREQMSAFTQGPPTQT
jgi:hypothetical protein